MHRLDGLGGGGRGGGWGSQVVSDATMNRWFVCVCVWRGGGRCHKLCLMLL